MDTKSTSSFKRKHPAHPQPIDRYNSPTILLVTVITWKRKKILANNKAHTALVTAWHKADDWLVGNYTIMPDHIHLFCSPAKWNPVSVKDWCVYWKRLAGNFLPNLKSCFEWDCWDTQMRSMGHYCRKISYVSMNPVRAGLVEEPENWPFQGRINALWW